MGHHPRVIYIYEPPKPRIAVPKGFHEYAKHTAYIGHLGVSDVNVSPDRLGFFLHRSEGLKFRHSIAFLRHF